MTLEAVHQGRWNGSIPENATVQIGGPDEPWIAVDAALKRVPTGADAEPRVSVQATPVVQTAPAAAQPADATTESPSEEEEALTKRPTRWLLVVLLVVPPIWALVHRIAFTSGTEFLIILWAFCGALALVAYISKKYCDQTSKELIQSVLKQPAVLWSIVGVTVVLVLGASWSSIQHAMRERAILTVLAIEDNCTFVGQWETVSADELARKHDSAAKVRALRCEKQLEATAAEAYAEQCRDIVKRLDNGLTPDDEKHIRAGFQAEIPGKSEYIFGEPGLALARRIASRNLVSDDLRKLAGLPCGPAMKPEYWTAVSASTSAWTGIKSRSDLAESVRQAYGIPTGAAAINQSAASRLSPDVRAAVAENAEQKARKLGPIIRPTDGADAEELCMLAFALTGKVTDSCGTVKMRREQLMAKEEAVAAAAERARQAKEAAEERAREAKEAAEERAMLAKQAQAEALCKATTATWQRCSDACDAQWYVTLNDYQAEICVSRCTLAYPVRGCD